MDYIAHWNDDAKPFEWAATADEILVDAFRTVVDGGLRVIEGPRRPGDVVGAYARSDTAERLLKGGAEKTVADAVRDALAWTARRPAVLGP